MIFHPFDGGPCWVDCSVFLHVGWHPRRNRGPDKRSPGHKATQLNNYVILALYCVYRRQRKLQDITAILWAVCVFCEHDFCWLAAADRQTSKRPAFWSAFNMTGAQVICAQSIVTHPPCSDTKILINDHATQLTRWVCRNELFDPYLLLKLLDQRFSNCGPRTPGGPQDDRGGSAVKVKTWLKFQIRLSDQIRLSMSHNVVWHCD